MKEICKYLWGLLIIFIFCQETLAQETLLRSVSYKEGGYNYSFYVEYQNEEVRTNDDLVYYWFDNGEINQNRGGYSGLLLQGSYEKTTIGGKLIEKGSFENGLKNGQWKKWNVDGDLVELLVWKRGTRHGKYWSFDPPTNARTIACYKNNLLNGWMMSFQADSLTKKTKFRKGNVVSKKSILKGKERKPQEDNEKPPVDIKKED